MTTISSPTDSDLKRTTPDNATHPTESEELHLQNLPRARRTDRHATDDKGTRPSRGANGLQPVELAETPGASVARKSDGDVYLLDDKAREAELMQLNAAPPSPPRPKAPAEPAPSKPRVDVPSPPAAKTVSDPAPTKATISETTAPKVRLPETVQPPSGRVWLSGRTLHFPAGVRLAPGEKLTVGGRLFEVRSKRIFTPLFWVKSAGVVSLVVLAALGASYLLAGTPGGSITGVVVDRATGRIIPDAAVEVSNGPSIRTNAAGLYSADNLAAGLFTLTVSAPGYESQTGTVVRPARENAQLAFALVPLAPPAAASGAPPSSAPRDAEPTATGEDLSASPIAFGNVTLDVDFSGYLVFLDDVIYGKDAKKLKRVSAGTHKIVLQLDGYEDYATSVEVKARATATISVAKTNLTPKVNPLGRAKGHFAEGKSQLDQGHWQAAIEAYDRGLEYDPENAEALQYRGWAYLKSNNTPKARTDFLAALQLHQKGGRNLDAVTCAGYLVDLEPNDPAPFRSRAELYVTLTEYDKAIADYERAVKLDKKSLDSQMGLAEVCFISGNFKRAAKEFDKARKLAQDPSDAYVRMLIALTRAGEDDQVRKKFKDFAATASPERLQELKNNPDWVRVLQIVDPTKRSEG